MGPAGARWGAGAGAVGLGAAWNGSAEPIPTWLELGSQSRGVGEARFPFGHATAVSLHVAVRENHGRATAGEALRGGFDKLSPNGL